MNSCFKNCTDLEKYEEILEKLETVHKKIELLFQDEKTKEVLQKLSILDDKVTKVNIKQEESEQKNFLERFFTQKEEAIKEELKEFIMENYNIKWLNDEIEENIYDFIIDAIWNLVIKKYF